MRNVLLSIILGLLTACGTPIVVKRETRDFVTAGNRAVDETRTFYDSLIAKDREATLLLLSSDPVCRAENPAILRGPQTFTEALKAHPEISCPSLPACDADQSCQGICMTDAELKCWNQMANADLDLSEVSIEYQTSSLPRKYFEFPLELVDQGAGYLEVLGELAEDAQPRIETRLTDLLARGCALRDRIRAAAGAAGPPAAPAEPATTTNCPSDLGGDDPQVSDTTLGKQLGAVGSLLDLLHTAHRNASDVKQLRIEVAKEVICKGLDGTPSLPRGECFERHIASVADDVENMHRAILIPANASIASSLAFAYNSAASKATQEQRSAMLAAFFEKTDLIESMKAREPIPALLLRATARAHAAFRDMLAGNYTEEQRREIAAENRKWLESFFKRMHAVVVNFGLL